MLEKIKANYDEEEKRRESFAYSAGDYESTGHLNYSSPSYIFIAFKTITAELSNKIKDVFSPKEEAVKIPKISIQNGVSHREETQTPSNKNTL